MNEKFIMLNYGALKDEDDARNELKEIEQKEKEVKAEAKKKHEACYL